MTPIFCNDPFCLMTTPHGRGFLLFEFLLSREREVLLSPTLANGMNSTGVINHKPRSTTQNIPNRINVLPPLEIIFILTF